MARRKMDESFRLIQRAATKKIKGKEAKEKHFAQPNVKKLI